MPRWVRTLLLLAGVVFAGSSCFGQGLTWKSPAPSPAEAAALLRAVCPGNVKPAGSTPGSLPACRSCPSFTTDGHPKPGISVHEIFSLRTVLYGSFTAPGVEEAVADFSGCEPHATEYGGSILLWKLRNSWTMVDYTPALITSACRVYHLKTGRDFLLCEGDDHHMAGSWQGISTCDFAKQKSDRCRNVFAAVNTSVACGHSAVWSSINRVVLRDLNGDGMPDLALSVSVGQGTFPNPGGSCIANASTQSVHKYRLDFLFQPRADRFYPAPWSKTITERLRAIFKDAQAKALKAVISDPGP